MSTQLISIGASGISVLLGLWFLGSSFGNQGLQRTLQKKQDDIQARQAAIQTQQQELQSQQQLIDAGSQLAQQVGPAMIRDLAALQLDKNNKKIAQLLLKYGIEAKANPAPANAPAPTAKSAPNPPPAPPAASNPKPQNGGQ
jgi:peptidoglycan hydrolase CwlO-like protein